MVDSRDPVVGVGALLLVQDPMGKLLGELGAPHTEPVLLPRAGVPTSKEETGVVDIVVEVVVREEQVVDLGRMHAHGQELVDRSWATVE